jgi:heme/copper-type cytochrome/quinol oxidase subunit 2
MKPIMASLKFDSYAIPDGELSQGSEAERLLKTNNPLVVPVGTRIKLVITSDDVIHSFAIPGLGVKMDAVPGRMNTITTYISDVGTYYGQCSELCGAQHAFMPIEIQCVDKNT